MSLSRGITALCAAVAIAMLASGPVHAQQAWPTKPVHVVVPFAAGGTTDILARVIGQKLSDLWGQAVIVDNRGGAGGNLGADAVAKAPPDGYTLLMASGSFTINPHLYKKLAFDPQKDFIPITNVAQGPMLVVVHPSVPAKNVKELIALAKAKPGTVTFGSAGPGSQVHMAAENFADAAGIDLVHVPYKGESLAYNDLIGGVTQMMVGNIAAASNFVQGGKLRALAVTGKARSKMLPDVPTVEESGLPGFENVGWFGFLLPAGTPKDIVDTIYRDTIKVLNDGDVQARLSAQGMTAVGNSPDAFSKAIREESAKWAKVIKNRKLSAN